MVAYKMSMCFSFNPCRDLVHSRTPATFQGPHSLFQACVPLDLYIPRTRDFTICMHMISLSQTFKNNTCNITRELYLHYSPGTQQLFPYTHWWCLFFFQTLICRLLTFGECLIALLNSKIDMWMTMTMAMTNLMFAI